MDLLIRKKHLVTIILIGIILFHFFDNFMWLSKDNFKDSIDDSHWHIIEAIKFHLVFKKILQTHSSLFVKTEQVFHAFRNVGTDNWPPMIYFLSALINPHELYLFRLRMYINFIFYILLILSVYFLGKKCFNRRIGLIAAFLISFYPAVYIFSRQFGLDFPLLSLTAVCVCLLLYSESFSNRGYSLWFGLSLGIATLVKLQIMFFLLVPLLYAIFSVLRQKNNKKFHAFSNLILSFILTFLLASLYWGNKLGIIFSNFCAHAFSLYPFYTGKRLFALGSVNPIFSLRNMVFHLEGLLFQTYLHLFILFICSLSLFLLKKNKWRTFFLLNLLVPYLIFTFISVKWIRYTMPLLIFMAIISAWLVDSLRIKYLRVFILCVLVFYCLHVCILNSWVPNNYRPVTRLYKSTINSKDSNTLFIHPPNLYDYIAEMKKGGIIPSIEQRLSEGKIIRIEFKGDNVEQIVARLYLYFQDAIFNNRIDIYQRPKVSFQDADYIVMRNSNLLEEKDLLKKYKIFSELGNNIFLIKNEKDSII